MVMARKYVVVKYFQGLPKRDDFEIVEYELPPLEDDHFIIKAEWLSVEPYHRAYNYRLAVPYDQTGYQIGTVIESKNSEFPVGCKVITRKGWCDYCVITDNFKAVKKVPDMGGLPIELSIGALGMPGATAYFGLLEICHPKAGETVVVSGAAGAIGSLVGQIAKIKGCKVIGFAGSDDKVQWLEKELGFDKAINYKTVDVSKALKKAAPKGVDCYFDNVGGELTLEILNQMNMFGRVSLCGCISVYNEDIFGHQMKSIIPRILLKQLKVEGFNVFRWSEPVDRWPEAFAAIAEWIKDGKLKTRNHITEGFDKIYDAFVGMLVGENTGKTLIKV